ncbi:peptide/nickel transport system substrate-binding protein [Blastococcus colisei]|uniref:Peptide/nickel transport system substrate-binding protein n=1 Tax=Blastococcus colisei TaxID=1564162 RepID=A0A543PIJ9_9ACTN|nr:ABC transporter substrate-binding protein [Blastococcus colisei]TQN43879.1 peptide/nickel transport system substrate-binding protein [Blastococcus colisei]
MLGHRRFTHLSVAVAAATLVSACGSGSTDTGDDASADNREAQAGGTLVLALAEDPDALDPTLARTLVGREVFVNMCEKLYDVNEELELIPQLAEELPEVSEDGTVVTIKVRQGITFNDGTPFDAAAVKTSLDRHRTLEGSARTGDLAQVESVEVLDPTTVQLTLSSAFAPLTAQLADRAGMIMSPAQLETLGDAFGSDPVCVGPFEFESRTPGNEIVLTKATDYYDADNVKLDGVTYRVITDGNVRLANVNSGDVHVAERIAATDVAKVEGDTSVKLIGQESLGYQGISINIGNVNGIGQPVGPVDTPLGSSPELREAFELSLDRDVINEVVFAGKYTPGCTPLPPASPYHDESFECSQRDVERAKELIADAGVSTPVPVTLVVNTSPENLRLGQVIQSQAKEAGFDVTVAPTEFASALDASDAGNFDTFQVGWSGRVDPDGNIYNFLHTGAPLNITGESNPELDQRLEQARLTSDQEERKQLYAEALQIAAEDRPILYLYHPVNYLVTGPDVVGLEYYADGLPRLATAGFAQ